MSTPASVPVPRSIRVGGKQWKLDKSATNRSQLPKSRQTPFELRQEEAKRAKEVKLKEGEMKAEKIAELEARKKAIQEKREKAAEKERYDKLKEKMHQKSVDRMRKREKRNKLLKDR
ncbi:protein of unknown function [Taphrina deformans PYCC 5710]|uniref:rRNA-processing protein n=1 Tax=Taphrina deformans (strain PYCC 5710 / ATCC 11124 / CBS 356.35 / IMI 108563 / JCM 9778 / NBRC 8474) TaxID=1097556 RepID=R4XKP5_TAPDE|nr:protein of unknown function [Taphrina deformans PYCC 5710]|eukprot:CCG83889.1 protein of unknown function [Taphrina deformans PYCC 5710]